MASFRFRTPKSAPNFHVVLTAHATLSLPKEETGSPYVTPPSRHSTTALAASTLPPSTWISPIACEFLDARRRTCARQLHRYLSWELAASQLRSFAAELPPTRRRRISPPPFPKRDPFSLADVSRSPLQSHRQPGGCGDHGPWWHFAILPHRLVCVLLAPPQPIHPSPHRSESKRASHCASTCARPNACLIANPLSLEST